MTGRTDAATRLIRASAEDIYQAFIDAGALMAWLPPQGMSGRILLFEPREGGRYRIELTLEGEGHGVSGKTTDRTDIASGRFLALEPGRRIVHSVEFELGRSRLCRDDGDDLVARPRHRRHRRHRQRGRRPPGHFRRGP